MLSDRSELISFYLTMRLHLAELSNAEELVLEVSKTFTAIKTNSGNQDAVNAGGRPQHQ